MVRHCMVLFCPSRGNHQGVYYFCLTSKRYDLWMRAIGRDPTKEKLSSSNLICSEHFSDDSFHHINGKRCLKPGAIPTLKLGPRKPLLVLNYQVLRSEEEIPNISRHKKIRSKSMQNTLVDGNLLCRDVDSIEEHKFSSHQVASSETSSHAKNLSKDLESMNKSNKIISKKLKNARERIHRLSRKVTELKQIIGNSKTDNAEER